MYEHSEMHQQRVDALSVRRRDGQALKRVGEEQHDGEEEQQYERHYAERVGCGVRQSLADGQDGDCGYCGKHKRKVQQRAGVARVEGDPCIDMRHGDVAVLGDIAHAEVARYEGVHERSSGYEKQQRHRVEAVARACGEVGYALPCADERAERGISRYDQRDY